MKAAPVHRALQELARSRASRSSTPASTTTRRCPTSSSSQLGLPKPDVFLGVGSGTHGRADREGARRDRGGAARAAPRPGRRPRRRQLDARRRARRGQARHPGRPPRGGPAQLRPADAGGAQPACSTDHSQQRPPRPLRERARQPRARGHRPRAGALRRQHDDRLASSRTSTRRAREQPWEELGVRARRVRPRHAAPPGARRRPGAARPRRSRGSTSLAAHVSGRLPGASAHARSTSSSSASRRRLARGGRAARARRSGTSPSSACRRRRASCSPTPAACRRRRRRSAFRCFTLRDTTERPVTVELGTNTVLGARPERIAEIPELLDAARAGARSRSGTAQAGERAAEALLDSLARRETSVGAVA